MKKFIFLDDDHGKCWLIESEDQHNAIAQAVKEGYAEDMADFYYGLSDGQIFVAEVQKEFLSSEQKKIDYPIETDPIVDGFDLGYDPEKENNSISETKIDGDE